MTLWHVPTINRDENMEGLKMEKLDGVMGLVKMDIDIRIVSD